MIKAWSYSRYSLYEQCPFKAKLLYIDGLKEPSSEALEKGTKVHADIEGYLKGKGDFPQSAIKLMHHYEELAKQKPFTELQVCFNKDWQPVDWFAKDAWARIVIDALVKDGDRVYIVDHKTGKVRDTYEPQLELYALTGLLMFPNVNTVDTALYFVDAGRIIEGQQYTRADLEMLRAKWTDRVQAMLTDTEFKATPNQYCKWCHFSRKNSGVCQSA